MILYELAADNLGYFTNLVNGQGSTELLSEREFIIDWRGGGGDSQAAAAGGE